MTLWNEVQVTKLEDKWGNLHAKKERHYGNYLEDTSEIS